MSGSTGEKPPVLVLGNWRESARRREEGPDIEERGTKGRPNTSGWQLRCANREGAGPWAVSGATLEISRTKRPPAPGISNGLLLAAVFPDFSDELG